MPNPTDNIDLDDLLAQAAEENTGFTREDALRDIFRPQAPRLRTEEELAAEFPNWRRDMDCPECDGKLVLKDGKFGIFYGCERYRETGCKGAHNCHKRTAEPLGIPADWETRQLRKKAHEVFDLLWKAKSLSNMSRQDAYRWMQANLGLSESDAHIAKLDKAGCEKLIRAVDRYVNPPTRFDREDPI